MSLEAVIQENTAALRALHELLAKVGTGAVMQQLTTVQAAPIVESSNPSHSAAEETAKGEEKKPAATPAAQETKVASTGPAAESPSEPAATFDYTKDVKPLLVKLSTAKGRDALVALLTKFGVTKGDQLPQDQLANVIEEINALLAA